MDFLLKPLRAFAKGRSKRFFKCFSPPALR